MQGATWLKAVGMAGLVIVLAGSLMRAQAQDTTTQGPAVAAAPVPAQIAAAKNVFIANGGADAASLEAINKAHQSHDEAYNEFYAQLKAAGQYTVVGSPADADLVFEVRFGTPISGCNETCFYAPQLTLTIRDAKTRFMLWTVTEPVQGANRVATWKRNFSAAIDAMVNDVKGLAAPGQGAGKN